MINTYENWENHFEEFINIWKFYLDCFQPAKITRIATRYINRINIPNTPSNFQEYFTYMPPIPKSLPQQSTNFFMQVHVPCDDRLRKAVITETMEQTNSDFIPFILDIDVYSEGEFAITNSELSKEFSEIRLIKNSIFESCITDKCRNLFK